MPSDNNDEKKKRNQEKIELPNKNNIETIVEKESGKNFRILEAYRNEGEIKKKRILK